MTAVGAIARSRAPRVTSHCPPHTGVAAALARHRHHPPALAQGLSRYIDQTRAQLWAAPRSPAHTVPATTRRHPAAQGASTSAAQPLTLPPARTPYRRPSSHSTHPHSTRAYSPCAGAPHLGQPHTSIWLIGTAPLLLCTPRGHARRRQSASARKTGRLRLASANRPSTVCTAREQQTTSHHTHQSHTARA